MNWRAAMRLSLDCAEIGGGAYQGRQGEARRANARSGLASARSRGSLGLLGRARGTAAGFVRRPCALGLRPRRVSPARWQDRIGHFRLLAGQTAEKGRDLIDLVIGQLNSELA